MYRRHKCTIRCLGNLLWSPAGGARAASRLTNASLLRIPPSLLLSPDAIPSGGVAVKRNRHRYYGWAPVALCDSAISRAGFVYDEPGVDNKKKEIENDDECVTLRKLARLLR